MLIQPLLTSHLYSHMWQFPLNPDVSCFDFKITLCHLCAAMCCQYLQEQLDITVLLEILYFELS